MKKLLGVVALISFCALLSRCTNQSEPPPKQGKIKISRSPSLQAMECFLVNVRGTNVKTTFQAVDLNDKYEMNCLGLGTVSKLVSPTKAESTGIEFEVRSGPARTIEVYGITQGAGAGECDGSTLDQVLNSGASLYLVGSTLTDLTVDAAVAIKAEFDPATAIDKGKVCRNDILPASQFAISGSSSPAANGCTKFTLTTQNALDETTAVTKETELTITYNGSGTIYSDSSCLSQNAIKVEAEQSTTDFYFKDPVAESVTFAIAASNFTTKTHTVNVAAGTAVGLSLPVDDSIAAGLCKQYAVRAVDAYGNTANVDNSVTVSFSKTGNAGLFSNSGCSTPLSAKTITSGTSSTVFYFKNNSAESVTVTATTSDLRTASDNMSITTAAGTVSDLKLPADNSVAAGACTTYTVASTDNLGNPVNVGSNTVVNLASTGTGAFYTTNACSTTTSSVTISNGTSSTELFFKNDTAQTVTVTASTARLRLNSDTMDVSTTAGTLTSLKLPADNSIAAGACTTYSVKSTDNLGNPVNVSSDTTINLAATGAGAFYTSGSCSTTATSVTISNGTSSADLFFKNNSAQTVTITASTSRLRLNSDSMDVTTIAGSVSSLQLPADTTISSGACATYTVKSTDNLGNPVSVSSDTVVNLTSSGSGAFYTSNSCSTTATSVTISNGTSSADLFFKNNVAQTVTITAGTSRLRLNSDTMTVTTTEGTVSAIRLPADDSIAAGTCKQYTVQTTDEFGNPASVSSPTTISLAKTGNAAIYGNANCTGSPITSVEFSSGNSTTFHFKNDTAQTVTVTASTSRRRLTSDSMDVTTTNGTLSSLRLPADNSIAAGTCTTYAVKSTDALGNPVSVSSDTIVGLASTGSGAFYTANDCSTVATSVTIGGGTNTVDLFFKNNTAETVTITASSSRLRLDSATMNVTTTAGSATKLRLPADNTISAGACTTYTVEATDTLGNQANVTSNTTVNLANNGAGGFFSNNACATIATSVTIGNGTSSADLFFKNNTAQTVTITASTSRLRLNSDTMDVTTTPGAPAKLTLPTNNTIAAGECKEYGLTINDNAGNQSKVTGNLTINLTSTGNGHFYTANDCAIETTTATIADNTSATSIFFRNTTAQLVDITAAAASLRITNADMSVNTTPLTASKLKLPPDATIITNQCAAYSAKSTDTFGNLVNVFEDTMVTFSASSGAVYADSNCTSGLASATISANSQSVPFYFKNSAVATATITANTSGRKRQNLDSDSMDITTTAATVAQLKLPATSTITAGTCQKYTVTSADAGGNSTVVPANTTVHLTSTQATTLFTENTCATGGTDIVINQGESTADFYFRSNTAGLVTVNASVSGRDITAAEIEITVNAAAFAALKVPASQSTTAGTCLALPVTTTDLYGNPKKVASDTLVVISSSGHGKLYSNVGCTSEINNLTVTSDTSAKTVYFKNESVETVSVSVDPGRKNRENRITSDATSITTTAAAVAKVVLPADSGNLAGDCLALTVQTTDEFGNLKAPGASVTVTFSKSGGGAIYSDSTCTTAISTTQIGATETSAQFYYQNLGVQSETVTATPNLGLDPDAIVITTTANTVSKLVLPADESHAAGTCVAVTVTSTDQHGNPATVTSDTTVNLTNTNAGHFYELSNCNTQKSTVTITQNTSSATFYYRNTTAEADNITTSSLLRLAPDTMTITTTPAAVAGLRLPADSSTPASTCTEYTVTSTDQFGNAKTVANDMLVTFLISSGTRRLSSRSHQVSIPKRAGNIFAAPDCTGSSPVTILQNTSSVSFYFLDSTAETVNVAASASGSRFNDSMTITVTPGTPTVLEFPSNNTILSGACTPYNVRTKDDHGNYAPVSSPLTIQVSSQASTLFSDSDCANALSGGLLTIPVNTSTGTFYYRNNQATSQTIYGVKSGFTSNTMSVVTAPNKTNVFGVSSVNAGQCGALSITTASNDGTVSPLVSTKTFDLTDSNATFYDENNCQTEVTSLTMASGQSLRNFGFKSNVSGTHTIALTDHNGLMLGSSTNVNVLAGTSAKIAIQGDSAINATECKPYTVVVQDAFGNATTAANFLSINFTGVGSQLYNDVNCTNLYGNINVAQGAGGGTLYFRPTRSQHVLLEAASSLNTAGISIAARGGILDTSFGTSGLIVTSMGTSDDTISRVLKTPDGKLLAAGFATTPVSGNHDFALTSYETNGELSNFGVGGRAFSTVSATVDDEIYGAAVANDGKILVAGSVNSAGDHSTVIARYQVTGLLDSSFGGSGIRILNLVPNDHDKAMALGVYGDGTIVTVGSHANCGFEWEWISQSGSPLANLSDCSVTDGAAKDLLITGNAEVVAVGHGEQGEIALQRQKSSPFGYDPTFGVSGKVLTTLGDESALNAIVRDTSGRYVVAGYVKESGDSNFVVARYLTTGALDTSFNRVGYAINTISVQDDVAQSVVVQADGKIVAAGWGKSPVQLVMTRYTFDGAIDTLFGTDGSGVVVTSLGSSARANSVLEQADGKLVIGGATTGPDAYLMGRYIP